MNKNTEYKKISFKDVYSIPNILCYIRILLIPVFIYIYINANNTLDFCDGFIARKFNQVTELGKLIDPIADKLTQAAIIIVLIFKFKWIFFLVILFFIKELYMLINGIILLRKGKILDCAMWFGKVILVIIRVLFIMIYMLLMIIFW